MADKSKSESTVTDENESKQTLTGKNNSPAENITGAPPAAVSGLDAEKQAGLDLGKIAATDSAFTPGAAPPPVAAAPEKRGRGRPPKDGTAKAGAAQVSKRSHKASPPPAQAAINAESRASAEMIVGIMDMFVGVVGGLQELSPEEAARDEALREGTIGAWDKYLVSKGATLPPWAEVAVMSLAYSSRAFRSPTGKEKAQFLWQRTKNWFGSILNRG